MLGAPQINASGRYGSPEIRAPSELDLRKFKCPEVGFFENPKIPRNQHLDPKGPKITLWNFGSKDYPMNF